MTVLEMIRDLQILATSGHADKELVYAIDDEGNGYRWVTFSPSLMKMGEDLEDVDNAPDLECNIVCIN